MADVDLYLVDAEGQGRSDLTPSIPAYSLDQGSVVFFRKPRDVQMIGVKASSKVYVVRHDPRHDTIPISHFHDHLF